MAQVNLGGNPINTAGNLPQVGSSAPDFELVNIDLAVQSLKDFSGNRIVLNIFPSVDTGVCAASIRKFNELANKMENTKVLSVSKDLPFAMNRLCTSEGLENIVNLSAFRGGFDAYGVEIVDSAFTGLFSRAIVVIDESGNIIHTEQVPEIGQEPDYDAVLAIL